MLRSVFEMGGRSWVPWCKRVDRRGCDLLWGSLLLMMAACGSDSHPDPDGSQPHYFGTVDGTDAQIAIVRDASRWVAYVCGGPSTLASITTWFQGTVTEGDDGVVAEADDKELDASFSAGGVEGTLTYAGHTAAFAARRVAAQGSIGLFQDDSNGCRAGLIVPPTEEGEPLGAYCKIRITDGITGRFFEQVTPITPITLRNGFISARASSTNVVLRLVPVALPLDAE